MSDSRNDGWGHRSEMAGPSDPGLKTVTQNVNVRRDGEVHHYNPSGDTPRQEPDEGADNRDWEDGLEARYLPNGRYDGSSNDERSNRERLLDGETV